MRDHYSLDNLKRAINNPSLIVREINRVLSLPIHHTYGRYLDERYSSKEVDVMQRDWDTLIILDACRFDYFEQQNPFDEDPKPVISRGKMSWEFMEENFAGRDFHDTIYITSNPFANQLPEDTFFDVNYLEEQWDADRGTIHPEDVASAAIDAHQRHPNKRLIVHFMQPHRPYLGPMADSLRDRVDLIGYQNEGDGLQIWGAAKQKEVSAKEVRQAYSESLDIVLGEVAELVDTLGGKSVITSDHGEMLGERLFTLTSRVWGHSEGFSTPQLRKVPWLTVENGDRWEIMAEEPLAKGEDLDDETVSDRLRALGYKDE